MGSSSSYPDRTQLQNFVRLLTVHEPEVQAFLLALLQSWHAVVKVAQKASRDESASCLHAIVFGLVSFLSFGRFD